MNRTFHGGSGRSGNGGTRRPTPTLSLAAAAAHTYAETRGAKNDTHAVCSPRTGAQQIKGIITNSKIKKNNHQNKPTNQERTRDSAYFGGIPHTFSISAISRRAHPPRTVNRCPELRDRILAATDHVCNQPEQRQGHPKHRLPHQHQRSTSWANRWTGWHPPSGDHQ